jgi:hypothetical protein
VILRKKQDLKFNSVQFNPVTTSADETKYGLSVNYDVFPWGNMVNQRGPTVAGKKSK